MLIDIPEQAVTNRIIPKDRFNFKDQTQINRIRWVGKLSSNTLHISSKHTLEIEVISIDMSEFDQQVVEEVANRIPQEILFIVNEDIVMMRYNHEWFSKHEDINLKIKGLTIDEVRDNFVRQLLDIDDLTQPLISQIDLIQRVKKLEADIDQLNTKIKRTMQLNKKQSLARKRYDLEKELAQTKGE